MRGGAVTWVRITKGDPRGRRLADEHYTRQTPGAPSWTRPGFNHVLWWQGSDGVGLWCVWRPKWEAGIERKDRLRVLECTMFRRTTDFSGLPFGQPLPIASEMIRAAVAATTRPAAVADLHLDTAGDISAIITGVRSDATMGRRGRATQPGHCFRMAGWQPIDKVSGRADVWLACEVAR